MYAIHINMYGVLHLYVKLLKSLDDVSCGVNILVVRLIENGGEDMYCCTSRYWKVEYRAGTKRELTIWRWLVHMMQ